MGSEKKSTWESTGCLHALQTLKLFLKWCQNKYICIYLCKLQKSIISISTNIKAAAIFVWPTAPGNAVSAAGLYLELFDLPEAVSVWPTAPGVAVQAHPSTKITFGKKIPLFVFASIRSKSLQNMNKLLIFKYVLLP